MPTELRVGSTKMVLKTVAEGARAIFVHTAECKVCIFLTRCGLAIPKPKVPIQAVSPLQGSSVTYTTMYNAKANPSKAGTTHKIGASRFRLNLESP